MYKALRRKAYLPKYAPSKEIKKFDIVILLKFIKFNYLQSYLNCLVIFPYVPDKIYFHPNDRFV